MAFPVHPAGPAGIAPPPPSGMGLGPAGTGAPGPSISQLLAGLAAQHGAPMSLTAHPGSGGGPHMGGGGGGPPPAMPPGGLGPPPGVRPPSPMASGGGGPPPMVPPVGAAPKAPRGGPQRGIKIKPAPMRIS